MRRCPSRCWRFTTAADISRRGNVRTASDRIRLPFSGLIRRCRLRSKRFQQESRSLLSSLPDIGTALRQADVCEDATDKLARHLGRVDWLVVESRNHGKDGRSGVGGECHVAKVNFVEGRLAHAEDERATLLEADICGAFDEILSEAVGDSGESASA